jgi:hypothetical protein
MAEQKNPCGCGCLPLKKKEVKATVPTKMAKEGKEVPKKSK